MSTGIILNGDGLEIPVNVVRKRVKNLNLRVRADGTVTLSIPQHLPLARAREFLDRKGDWIAERVRRNIERRPSPDLAGELPDRITLWGTLVPRDAVRAISGQAASGRDAGGQGAPGQTTIDQAALDELCRTEVLRALPGIVERMEARIGVHAARWSVRVMKTRWGSCTPKTGAIRINARLAAYPRDENTLGFVHAENRRNPHQRPTGRLSARVPGVRGGARARAPSGAEPQRPLPHPAR